MKKTIVAILMAFSISTIAQSSGTIYDLNMQLRHVFSQVNPTPINYEYIYDIAVHSTDTNANSVLYDHLPNDTLNTSIYFSLYEEHFYMAKDTSNLLSIDSLAKQVLDTNTHDTINAFGNYVSGKIPIAIAHYNYNILKPNVLDSANINTFFVLDTSQNLLYDNTDLDTSDYPFKGDSVFNVSALMFVQAQSNMTFVIDKQWMLLDSINEKYYAQGTSCSLLINFDDGQGYRSFNPSLRHEIEVNYSTSGDKIIDVQLIKSNADTILAQGRFRLKTPPTVVYTPPNQRKIGPGYNAAIYEPCNAGGEGTEVRKVAVIFGGYDPFDDESSEDTWQNVGEQAQIQKLLDFGYEFHVVDFTNSTVDMRLNADVAINYLDELKCELLGSNPEDPKEAQPMVVIGYSMGGVIANYALTKWEQDPYVSNCHIDYLHFTRTLITIDSPHEGANVPLAYQHFYKDLDNLQLTRIVSTVAKFINGRTYHGMLKTKAAQQMLMYHVDTKNGHSYDMHHHRKSFLNDLNDLGGRPQKCKVMAVSMGAASGIGQKRDWDNNPRTPGDRFLNFYMEKYGKFLIFNVTLFDLRLDLNSSNGSNRIYHRMVNEHIFKIKISWKGIKLRVKNPIAKLGDVYANIQPYDVESGGFFPGITIMKDNEINKKPFLGNSLHIFSGYEYLGGGNYKAHYGFDLLNLYGFGVKADFSTDGFGFNFVPLRSALSYGGNIYQGPLSPNIENASPSMVMSQTPFDVILAVGEDYRFENSRNRNEFNLAHTNVFNPFLKDPDYFKDTLRLRSCNEIEPRPIAFLLNREVGDESLYLENFEQVFPKATYKIEYDIFINQRNPAYQYPIGSDPDRHNSAAYSDDRPFTQHPSTSKFISDETGANALPHPGQSQGWNYNAPYTGIWSYHDEAVLICCNEQYQSRIKRNTQQNINYQGLINDYHLVKIENLAVGTQIDYQLISLEGKIIQSGQWFGTTEGIYRFKKPANKGIFLLRTQSQNQQSNLKFLNF